MLARSLFLSHGRIDVAANSRVKTMADMSKYQCNVCYVYDPAEGDTGNGVQPGTAFSELPEESRCPLGGNEMPHFTKIE